MHAEGIKEGAFFMMASNKDNETNALIKFLPAFAVIGTIMLTFGAAQSQILRAQADINQLQESHRTDHDRVLEIKSDIRYIKEKLDQALKNGVRQ